MQPMKVTCAYIPKRLEATTLKQKAQQFNRWAKKLDVSEVCDR